MAQDNFDFDFKLEDTDLTAENENQQEQDDSGEDQGADNAEDQEQEDSEEDQQGQQTEQEEEQQEEDAADDSDEEDAESDDAQAQQPAEQPEAKAKEIKTDAQDTSDEVFANDLLKRANEFVKNGGDLNTFLRTQSQDFQSMEPLELMRAKFQIENPDLSAEDIELLLEDSYKLDSDLYDAREVRLAEIRLARDAKQALPELKSWQVEQAKPVQQAQISEEWIKEVETTLTGFDKLTITTGKNGENVPVAVANKQEIEAYMKQPNSLFSRWVKPDGTADTKQYMEDLAWLTNRDKVVASLMAKGGSQKLKQVEGKLENPSKPKEQKATPAKSFNDELADAFLAAKSRLGSR